MLPNIDFLFSYHLYTYHKRIKVHRRRCPYRFPMNYRNPIESESFAPPGSPWPTRSADFAPGIHSIIPYFHGERSSWTVWLVFSRLKNVYIYTHTHIYIYTYTLNRGAWTTTKRRGETGNRNEIDSCRDGFLGYFDSFGLVCLAFLLAEWD